MNWPQAVRDIFVTSINRGRLPVLGLIVTALLVLSRIPAEELAKLMNEVIFSLKRGELWAYVVCMVLAIAWYFHARAMRRAFSDEAQRIGQEKSRIQSKAAGVPFKSSTRAAGRVKQGGI